MERLRFTYSRDINTLQIDYKSRFEFQFITAYGQTLIRWYYLIVHNEGLCDSDRNSLSTADPRCILNFDGWSCKFVLKRANQPDLEYSVAGVGLQKSFDIPNSHEIHKFFESHVKKPETKCSLMFVLDIPKAAFFAKNWPIYDVPEGRKKKNDFKILTIDDDHDIHFVCKDGDFYANRDDFIRIDPEYNMFKDMFENKEEIQITVPLEIMKMVANYMFTYEFIAPRDMKRETFMEIQVALEALRVPSDIKQNFVHCLDKYACCHFGEIQHSLYDLVVSWTPVADDLRLHCLNDVIGSIIVKKYFDVIITQYKADTKLEDKEQKEIHAVLHRKQNELESQPHTLFECLVKLHDLLQNVVVTEVVKQNEKSQNCVIG